jgi:hypothetical protein
MATRNFKAPVRITSTRPGKLGGAGYLKKTPEARRRHLATCVRKWGYRSCLGSIQALEVWLKNRGSASDKAKLRSDRAWLVSNYGAGSKKRNGKKTTRATRARTTKRNAAPRRGSKKTYKGFYYTIERTGDPPGTKQEYWAYVRPSDAMLSRDWGPIDLYGPTRTKLEAEVKKTIREMLADDKRYRAKLQAKKKRAKARSRKTTRATRARTTKRNGTKAYRFKERSGKAYQWSAAELHDTLFEGAAWGTASAKKKALALKPGESMTIRGETLTRNGRKRSKKSPGVLSTKRRNEIKRNFWKY